MNLPNTFTRLKLIFSLRKKKVPTYHISKKIQIKKGLRVYIGKRCTKLSINDHVKINRNVDLEIGGSLQIGERSVVGVGCFIQADGEVTIGNGVLMGPGSKIFSSTHNYGRNGEIHHPLVKGKVTIGNNVWIGADAKIAINVDIGDNAVIGANSFVNRSIPANCVAAGNPARIIKRI